MAKQLNVSLAFTADASAAQKEIKSLQNVLANLSALKSPGGGVLQGLSTEAVQAAENVGKLRMALEGAINVNTGRLNLTAFSQNLDKAKLSLNQCRDALVELGPEGAMAFQALAKSIITADSALTRGNKKLAEFATTLKNTVRWQFSSSMLHGFVGAVQSATGYAKDLNRSLNNIRIVTEASVEDMAEFAKRANSAARALSATTTEYTNAALIYYQQGLSEDEVQKRTELTIKMANASGQSAEIVSDQLTAIWNNFAKGGEDLEHFTNVLTKLGAATASSSEEISQGLEQFAAVGDMIGLSFDSAAAALATVTAETRQSADVVGTAFKTIFARIQGLSLGETLDDGTDLNKYSEALFKVGISIKDQNGALKDMDTVLNEMGAKWQLLSKDQQVALAQTVAGVRQYNQLVALMDNYDIYKQNLKSAQESEGALQRQADIYAESWEAARERVVAAAESIYKKLLDDDVFITFLNGFEKAISAVDALIDGMGGLKGVVSVTGAVLTKAFSQDIANTIDSISIGLASLTPTGRQRVEDRRKEAIKAASTMNVDMDNAEGAAYNEIFKSTAELQELFLEKSKYMSEEQIRLNQLLLDGNKTLSDRNVEAAKNLDAIREQTTELDIQNRRLMSAGRANEADTKLYHKTVEAYKSHYKALQSNEKIQSRLVFVQKDYETNLKGVKKGTEDYTKALEKNKVASKVIVDNLTDLKNTLQDSGDSKKYQNTIDTINELVSVFEQGTATQKDFNRLQGFVSSGFQLNANELNGYQQTLFELLTKYNSSPAAIQNFISALERECNAENISEEAKRRNIEMIEKLKKKLQEAGTVTMTFSQQLTTMANVGMTMMSIANSISGLIETLNEAETPGEKLVAIATSLISIIPMLVMCVDSLSKALKSETAEKIKNTGASIIQIIQEKLLTKAKKEGAIATEISGAALKAHPIMWIVTIIMAVVAAVTICNTILEQNTKKLKENAEAANEEVRLSKERADANKELIDSYEDLLRVYKETGEGKDKLSSAAEEVAKAYGIEGAAIAILTGDYDKLTSAIRRARLEELEKDKKTADKNVDAQEEVLLNGLGKSKIYNGLYTNIFAEDHSSAGEVFGNQMERDLSKYFSYSSGGALKLQTGDSAEEIAAAYADISKYFSALEETADDETKNTKIYKELESWLSDNKNNYEAYINAVNDSLNIAIEKSVLEQDFSDIDTLKKYEEKKSSLIRSIAKSEGIKEGTTQWDDLTTKVGAYLSTLNEVSGFELRDQGFEDLQRDYKIAEKEAKAFYETLSPENQDLFWQINFDTAKNEEAWIQELKRLQAIADREKVEVKLKTSEEAVDLLKEDMSKEDYDKLKNSGIDWGNAEEGIIEFSDFIKLSYEEQLDFLIGLSGSYRDALIESTEWTVEALQAETDRIENEIKAQEQEVARLQQKRENTQGLTGSEISEINKDYENALKELEKLKQQRQSLIDQKVNLKDEYEIDVIIDADKDLEELQKKVEGIVNPIVSAFDAISSGVKRSMDESGNAVWHFSAEAAEAVSKIYPGFMKDLKLLEDGTFEVSDSIYEKILDTEKGSLKAKAETIAETFELEAEQAYIKAEFYKENADLAKEIASGEIKTDEELLEAKIKVLEAYNTSAQEAGTAQIDISRLVALAKMDLDGQTVDDNKENNEDIVDDAKKTGNKVVGASGDTVEAVAMNFDTLGDAVEETNERIAISTAIANKRLYVDTLKANMQYLTGTERREAQEKINATEKEINDLLKEQKASLLDPKATDNIKYEVDFKSYYSKPEENKEDKETDTEENRELVNVETYLADILGVKGPEFDEKESEERTKVIYDKLTEHFNSLSGSWTAVGDTKMLNAARIRASINGAYDDLNGDNKITIEELKEILERYREINEEIKHQEYLLNRIQKAKSRAYGKDKLALIQNEIDSLKELYILNDKLMKAQFVALGDDQQNLTNVFSGFNKDIVFEAGTGFIKDAEGNLLNSDLEKWAFDELKAARIKYESETAGITDSEVLKQKQEEYDAAKKLYEDRLDTLDQYEQTVEDTRKQQEKLDDIGYQIEDAKLEKITAEVDFEIEINEKDLAKLDYIVDELNRNVGNMVDVIDRIGQKVTSYQAQADSYVQGINDIKTLAATENRELTASEQATIAQYEDALLNINVSLMDVITTIEESLMKEFERLSSELDDNISRFDVYSSTLEHYNNIIKLSGRATKDSALLMKLAAQQTDISIAKLKAAKQKYDAQKASQAEVALSLQLAQESGVEADIKYWQDQYDAVTKAVEQSHTDMLESWSATLEAASAEFDTAIEITLQTLKDSISEYGLDGLADRYEKETEIKERYLSDLDKEYELNKLIRDMERSIDETDNIAAKQALNKLLDKTNQKLEKGVQLSKYDLDHMQKKYDLELARIALEEAQQAKSTVRLRRDSEGNFGYVYTADQDSIDDAKQNYEDKLYEVNKLSEDHITEISDLIVQNEQDMIDALASIDKSRFQTKEAYEAEVERITRYYLEKDLYLRQELDKAVVNSGKTYGDTILGQMENASTWQEAHNQLKTNTNKACDDMVLKWEEWKIKTEEAMGAAGTSADGLTTTITQDMSDIGTATGAVAGKIATQSANMSKDIGTIAAAVENWRKKYIEAIDEIIKKNEELLGIDLTPSHAYNSTEDYSSLMASSEFGSDDYWTYYNYRKRKEAQQGGNSIATTERIHAYLERLANPDDDVATLEEMGYKYFSDLSDKEWEELTGIKLTPTEEYDPTKNYAQLMKDAEFNSKAYWTYYYYREKKMEGLNDRADTTARLHAYLERLQRKEDVPSLEEVLGEYEYFSKIPEEVWKELAGFRTGGYTGSWGPEGKLAVLHEKELVLNENDTSNILKTVSFVRKMVDAIDAQAQMLGAFNMIVSPGFKANREVLEQEVTIHAEFPNVTQHTEIEEAFHNLINTASQYANRKVLR